MGHFMVNGTLYSAPSVVYIVKISNRSEAPDRVTVGMKLGFW